MDIVSAFLTAVAIVGGFILVLGTFFVWLFSMFVAILGASDIGPRGRIIAGVVMIGLPVIILTALLTISPYLR